MAGLCIKTPPSSEKDDVLMKNEHILRCCIYTESSKTDRCKRIIETIVRDLAHIECLADWNIMIGTETINNTGHPKTMVKHSIIFTHKHTPVGNRTQVEIDMEALAEAINFDWEVRGIFWRHEDFFWWQLQLSNDATAKAQNIWSYRIGSREHHRAPSAATTLVGFVDQISRVLKAGPDWAVARDVDKHFGKTLLDCGSILKRMAATTDAIIEDIRTSGIAAFTAKPKILDLFVLNQAGFSMLKKKCEADLGIKIFRNCNGTSTCSQMTVRENEVLDGDTCTSECSTLLDSDIIEYSDEKKHDKLFVSEDEEKKKKPGFFKRFIESRKEKCKEAARATLATQINDIHTKFARRAMDLQRLRSFHLNSLSLYAHLGDQHKELMVYMRAADEECGLDQLRPLIHYFQTDINGLLDASKEIETIFIGVTNTVQNFRLSQDRYIAGLQALMKDIDTAARTQALVLGE